MARTVTGARLQTLELPDFGMPTSMPLIPPATYAARLERLRQRADERGYDRLVIYGDREHSASLAWLSGFDPRFEEAIAIVGPTGDPAILVGNECWGMAGAALAGVILGVLFLLAGSLLLPGIAHYVANMVQVSVAYRERAGLSPGPISNHLA